MRTQPGRRRKKVFSSSRWLGDGAWERATVLERDEGEAVIHSDAARRRREGTTCTCACDGGREQQTGEGRQLTATRMVATRRGSGGDSGGFASPLVMVLVTEQSRGTCCGVVMACREGLAGFLSV
ncbi:nitrogenase iron protein [Sesbania bispinosa]|nr:nitrogenase iron protein [Sesbania bispinosa]